MAFTSNSQAFIANGGSTVTLSNFNTSGSFVVPANSYAEIYVAASASSTQGGRVASVNMNIGTFNVFSISVNNSSGSFSSDKLIAPSGVTVSYSGTRQTSTSNSFRMIYMIFTNSP